MMCRWWQRQGQLSALVGFVGRRPPSAAEPTVLESPPKQTHVIAGSSWECTVAQCQPSSIYLQQLGVAGGGGALMLAPLPPVSCWAPTGRWLRFPEASSLSPATKIITLEVCCRVQRAAVNHPAKYDLPVCANRGSCRQTTGGDRFESQTRGTRPLWSWWLQSSWELQQSAKFEQQSVFYWSFRNEPIQSQPIVTSQGQSNDIFPRLTPQSKCSLVVQSGSWSAWGCTLPTLKD